MLNFKFVFFCIFSFILLFSAFRVVTARNPVHAVLFLVLAFSQAAGIWILLQAEFLGIALVVVYLGAVMVLFLFVVMMLDIKIEKIQVKIWQLLPVLLLVGGGVAVQMTVFVLGNFGEIVEVPPLSVGLMDGENPVEEFSNSKLLGQILYTDYLYPVEIAAVILLVAMVSAIALTLRKRKDSKAIDPSLQVKVRAKDRITLVKVPVVRVSGEESLGQADSELKGEK